MAEIFLNDFFFWGLLDLGRKLRFSDDLFILDLARGPLRDHLIGFVWALGSSWNKPHHVDRHQKHLNLPFLFNGKEMFDVSPFLTYIHVANTSKVQVCGCIYLFI